MTETKVINTAAFKELSNSETCSVNGGGITAALYAAAFLLGTTPLGVIGLGLGVIGGCCFIYGVVTH